MKPTFLPLLLVTTLIATNTAAAAKPEDPNLWLENVTGKKALDWVKARNKQSQGELASSSGFKELNGRLLKILENKAKIPYVTKIGGYYYNFWQDADHTRGIWRRTSLDEYRKDSPAWELVLDVDALGRDEKESWVWEGAEALPPDYTRCLVSLSRGGADAAVAREFDLSTRSFVKDGFTLPESKSGLTWISRDLAYMSPAFDSTTMTTSGYPRVVKEWMRGTPYSSATTVYEGKLEDVSVGASHDHTPGFERDWISRGITFYSNETFLRQGGKLIKIDKPDDAEVRSWHEWLLFTLRTDWAVGGRTWPAGALLAANLEDFLAGKRELSMLFKPTERNSMTGVSTTKNTLLISELDNVRGKVEVVRCTDGKWSSTPMAGLPEFGSIDVSAVDDRDSDDYWLVTTDFLTPTTLAIGKAGEGAAEKLKHTPAYFDASRHEVAQYEAVSKDGTHIPYFLVAPKGLKLDGSSPTLLNGYGGFEVSQLPYYSGVIGSGWLERGGVFAVANIRGGGEFGPKWHQAGVKENRHHCYEDFIAVGEDLVRRGVTNPKKLGCIGGSNGGLLVGNMVTQRPDLFGAVVCQAPLLDMKRYHKLLAGASWMGEYGNPDDPKEWAFIKGFSPYQNLHQNTHYPRTLFTSSTRDDRVHPGHARKMVARMKEQGHDVLYYENIEGGHAGAADNKQQAFMSALEFTFLWKQLGPAHPAADGKTGLEKR